MESNTFLCYNHSSLTTKTEKSLKGLTPGLQYRLLHLTGISRQELIPIQNANGGMKL